MTHPSRMPRVGTWGVLVAATALAAARLAGQSTPAAPGPVRAEAPAVTPAAPATPARSARNASYEIDARLDVRSRILTGREIVTWRNTATQPTSELQLHLYYNAWRNERSSFLRAARRSIRPPDLSAYGPDDWAYCEIDAIAQLPREAGGPAVALATSYIQPDDGNPDDRTLLRVVLPSPVSPGETVRFEIRWRLKIPRPFQRVGVIGDYFLVGHWFPKVAVLGDAGVWRAHQFIQSEFFADFGVYDVRLTLPAGWTVAATGYRDPVTTNADGTVTHRFRADDVHDFAFTTSPRFVVATDRFERAGVPPVEIELLLMPDHAHLRDRYLASAKAALEHFGQWTRPYPWGRITIVDPPAESNTGGMEYPMFVTGESRWWTQPGNKLAEANTLHEVGHQWWQGAVANNEFEDAWLDESVTTWAHRRLVDVIYPPYVFEKRYFHDQIPVSFADLPRPQTTHGAESYDGLRSPLTVDVLGKPAFRYDERAYYMLPYNKGALMLVTLERYLGWETWRRVIAAYTERFWLRHPTAADFIAITNQVSGRDLSWFFDEVLHGTDVFDYAVDRVSSSPSRAPRGYGDGASPAWSGGSVNPGGGFDSVVDVRRWGGAVFPIEIRVRFDDGSVANETWDGRDRWTRFRYAGRPKVTSVDVDPRRVLVLDVNSTNNSWTSQPQAQAAATKWTAKWMIWLQHVLELAAFFA